MVILQVRERGDPQMKSLSRVARHVLLAATCCAGMSMIGCSVFVGRVVVTPDRAADSEEHFFDDSAKATGIEIGREVAEQHGLAAVSGPYTRLGGEDYATVSIYQDSGKIWLSLLIRDDGAEMVYVITDQDHGEETKTTADIRRDLVREVGERVPGTVVKFEYSKEKGSLMGP